jgi:hypothetical protein
MSKWFSVLSLAVILVLVQSGFAPTEVWSTAQGACCYADGSCGDELTEAECSSEGGAYMGDGTTCSGVQCVPDTGACCFPDGSCADDLTEAECSSEGGAYMGDGTTCSGVQCVPDTGACCFPDGSCADDLTEAECSSEGGAYMGDGTTCAGVDCGNDVKDETGDREKPSGFTLFQNHPNPFNQTTKIEFTLAKSGFVSLNIYDILGRKVRTLVSQHVSSGHKSVLWDGKDNSGNDVASGIYFYRVRAGNLSETKKLVLLK